MAYIDREIMFDILSRLPVKSLARFKTLNKLCGSFFTDPTFIKTHFKNSANKAENNNLCLILSCEEHPILNSVVHFLTVRDIDEVPVLEYSADLPLRLGYYNVLPSCNGLVCFHRLRGDVHVCNPSTKDIIRLPDIDAEGFGSSSYGLGFDELSGKYKVIQFLFPLPGAEDYGSKCRIEIFTMGDNSWKTIGYHSSSGLREPLVFAGGFFYWIRLPHISSLLIVSYDIAKGICEEISPPEGIRISTIGCKLYPVRLRGELCLVDLDSAEKRMNIWILKRNVAEKKQNWVRVTIAHQSEDLGFTRPVAFNGEEILLHGYIRGQGFWHSYNLQTGCFTHLNIKGTRKHYFYASHHVESLFRVR